MALTNEPFGCKACFPPDADKAWEAVLLLKIDYELIEESHFIVKLRSCPACQQHFVTVFSETIDWVDGEDPQFWSVLPITLSESKQLLEAGNEVLYQLDTLAPGRRSLCHDFPKGENPKSFWCRGITIELHD